MAVFVDTNVLVCLRDSANARKQALAAEWMSKLWDTGDGRTSFQVLTEYYAVATRKLRPAMSSDAAWSDVRELLAWRPQESNGLMLELGRDIEARFRLSWWDSLIIAAARLQNCETLLTEDLQHGANLAGVTVVNPFITSVKESAVQYGAAGGRPAHPRRGRPRKTGAGIT